MLASINPLGERGRNNRFWLTATAYLAGTIAGGVAIGALLGWLGSLARSALGPQGWDETAPLLFASIAAVGLAFDLIAGGRFLPTNHRQVDERWLENYRGWVYGFGFGFQLGFGIMTFVKSSAIYVLLALEFLSAHPAAGAALGAVFGIARAVPLLWVRDVVSPAGLRDVMGASQAWRRPIRITMLVVQGATIVVVFGATIVTSGATAWN